MCPRACPPSRAAALCAPPGKPPAECNLHKASAGHKAVLKLKMGNLLNQRHRATCRRVQEPLPAPSCHQRLHLPSTEATGKFLKISHS